MKTNSHISFIDFVIMSDFMCSKFWSKRVGIDHTRVLMTELVEAAMDEFSSRFLTSARRKSKFLNEKIADMLDEPDVALQRLLSKR